MVQARTSAKEFFNADERLADLGLIAVPGAEELTAKIDRHLLRWAQEAGMDQDTFIIESECPRFSSGDGKGLIRSTVRGDDIYFVVDVGNYNQKYKIFGHENFMSPYDHFQNLKRLIQATSGKAKRMSVIMPLLYGSRQHRRAYRESLDCAVALQELQAMGIRVVMLTGDNQRTAAAIGRQAGVDEVIAGVLPDGKEAVIRQLQASGKVAMVGDGINDAPALTRADTGIAIGAGTDVAIDAADVVLMNSKLSDVPAAIRLSRAALRNIHENLFWAFIYNIIGIPLAAGVFIPFGLTLNPMFGAAAMSLSSFCVVSNALRLNLFDVHSTKHDRAAKNAASLPAVSAQPAAVANKESTKEDTAMKKTLKVEGMMCGHCEARVKKALEALPEVDEAVVSHEAGTAIVTLNAEVADDVLKKAVEDQDYPVTGIQ